MSGIEQSKETEREGGKKMNVFVKENLSASACDSLGSIQGRANWIKNMCTSASKRSLSPSSEDGRQRDGIHGNFSTVDSSCICWALVIAKEHDKLLHFAWSHPPGRVGGGIGVGEAFPLGSTLPPFFDARGGQGPQLNEMHQRRGQHLMALMRQPLVRSQGRLQSSLESSLFCMSSPSSPAGSDSFRE